MFLKSTKDFQKELIKKLTFLPYKYKNFIIYKNPSRPELGYLIKYSRDNYYELLIGDYTIGEDFNISFDINETLIRFGTVYKGVTKFKIENNLFSSFSPSSFFIVKDKIKGMQTWKKGQHFHGTEITIYKEYIDNIIKPSFKDAINYNDFITNFTYHYLPIEIVSIIHKLRSLAELSNLSPLYLESKILESIAILNSKISSYDENILVNELNYENVKIGKNRYITLTPSDIKAIQKAYDILTENYVNPPTISALSKIVFLNEQKLKAGFFNKYHMTISEYTCSIRMSIAENLLCTTELTIDEISKKVGYSYSSNFVKMFKKVHGKTPLAFRKLGI